MPPSSLRLPSQCDGVLDRAQALEGMAAARLEAVKDRPQMLVYVLLHKQDTVEVIGHKLKSNNGNIVITLLYLIPAGGYCLPQRSDGTVLGAPGLSTGKWGSPTTVPKRGWRSSVTIVTMYILRDW